MHRHKFLVVSVLCVLGAIFPSSDILAQEPTPPDLMSFAQGTLPVAISSAPSDVRVKMEHAVSAIDGNHAGYVAMGKPVVTGDVVTILYVLPSPTRFDGFAVPNISETPSPSQTFFRQIDILGSSAGPDGPFIALAWAELTTHEDEGQITALTMAEERPEVRWVSV
ncbi:MAG: hypothetical protein V2I76_03850, partial [Roseobacter sp.]|nr:hypothetical protein [Roseobacter sp.]